MNKAILALADGTVFFGRALGHVGESSGEVVFNTAMTGYQEILTDPSYKGQIVTMTCPHIGNYGVTSADRESRKVWADGFVVRESSWRPSNWRAQQSLHAYLTEAGIVGIEGLDTRALTRHLRDHGSQQGVISHIDLEPDHVIEKARRAPTIVGRDLVSQVTCSEAYQWTEGTGEWMPYGERGDGVGQPNRATRTQAGPHVVVYDFGVKLNILRRLVDVGCTVTVVPASTKAQAVLQLHPQGIVLSNGPGDPAGVPYAVKEVQQLIGKCPILGICLGHQVLGLAFGLQTSKLKFGHHGANHPVMDLRTKTVEITSQNHNFTVKGGSVGERGTDAPSITDTPLGRISFTHLSLDDQSIEGMVCLDHPVLSVQYHPEASPGPHDSSYLFEHFMQMVEKSRA